MLSLLGSLAKPEISDLGVGIQSNGSLGQVGTPSSICGFRWSMVEATVPKVRPRVPNKF